MLYVLSSERVPVETETLNDAKGKVYVKDSSTVDEIIIGNVKKFPSNNLPASNHPIIEAKFSIAQSLLGTEKSLHSIIKARIKLERKVSKKSGSILHGKSHAPFISNTDQSSLSKIQNQLTPNFGYSDEASTYDSNSKIFVRVIENAERAKYARRV